MMFSKFTNILPALLYVALLGFTGPITAEADTFDPDHAFARPSRTPHPKMVIPAELSDIKAQTFTVTPVGKEAVILRHLETNLAMQVNAKNFHALFHSQPALDPTEQTLSTQLKTDATHPSQRKILLLSPPAADSDSPQPSPFRQAESMRFEGTILTFDLETLIDQPPCGTRLAAFLSRNWDVYWQLNKHAFHQRSPQEFIQNQYDYLAYACPPRTHSILKGIRNSLTVQAVSYALPWVASALLPEYAVITWAARALSWAPTIHAISSGARTLFTLNPEERVREGSTTLTYIGSTLYQYGSHFISALF